MLTAVGIDQRESHEVITGLATCTPKTVENGAAASARRFARNRCTRRSYHSRSRATRGAGRQLALEVAPLGGAARQAQGAAELLRRLLHPPRAPLELAERRRVER